MNVERPNTVSVEIAWRWFFLVFAIAVVAGVALVARDAIHLRLQDLAAFRSRNPYWIAAAILRLVRRYRLVMESSLLVTGAILGGFWVLAGAAWRASPMLSGQAPYARRFLALLLLRTAGLAAGAAALFSCLAVILAATNSSLSPAAALAVVSVFSMVVYICWRWVSLFLAVLESAPSLERGWQIFASSVPRLGLAAATNSTLKWLALAAVTLPAAGVATALPLRWWGLELLTAAAWILALIWISGYFAARLRAQIAGLGAEPHGFQVL